MMFSNEEFIVTFILPFTNEQKSNTTNVKFAHNLYKIAPFIICKDKHIIAEFTQNRSFQRRGELVQLVLPLNKKENEM